MITTTDYPDLRPHQVIWLDGYDARVSGVPLIANPHTGKDATAWAAGWYAGAAKNMGWEVIAMRDAN